MEFATAEETTPGWFKILIYGNSGAGKTWRACQARRPTDDRKVLGLLTESNGVQSARHANPNILLPKFPLFKREKVDGKFVDVPVLDSAGNPAFRNYTNSMEEVRQILRR